MTDGSSWTELRYSATQALPEDDGIRDELDGIALWGVDAVRCFHDQPEQVVAHGDVAVFELESGLDLYAAALAYGGQIANAARMLLTPAGRLQDDLGVGPCDKVVLFLQVVIGRDGRGLGLPSAMAVRERLGSRRSLVGSFPSPRSTNAREPEFFAEVPPEVQEQWWKRGLVYRDDGLWLVLPQG